MPQINNLDNEIINGATILNSSLIILDRDFVILIWSVTASSWFIIGSGATVIP